MSIWLKADVVSVLREKNINSSPLEIPEGAQEGEEWGAIRAGTPPDCAWLLKPKDSQSHLLFELLFLVDLFR